METEEIIVCAEEKRSEAVRYLPFVERLGSEEIGAYTTYGIRALLGNEVLAEVSDITTDEEAAVSLARLCTENDLAVEHLFEVIEDFLGSF